GRGHRLPCIHGSGREIVSFKPPLAVSSTGAIGASRSRAGRVLPGFRLPLGFRLTYLSLIVLIPLASVFIKSATLSVEQFWEVVTTPRVVASYKLSFGLSLAAAVINSVFGLMLAWALVRYTFPGKRLVDAL